MTGKNPGKHGIYYFYERLAGSYDIRYLNGGDCKAETIWSILSSNGKKVGAINIPMTYPAEEVNGFIVAGMDAPGVDSPGFTYPEGLKEELLKAVPSM
jgi:predicted AlkP superfamily phosphohydrolase/phosphomutase